MKHPRKLYILLIIVVLAIIGLSNSLYTVDETQYAIVLQFGNPVATQTEPGLHFKVPFIQNVIYLDKRLLDYDVVTTIIYTQDKKNMVVDAFVRWRIEDPLLFYRRFKSDNSYSIIEDAKRRIGDVIIGELKSELGLHVMSDVISQSRETIMDKVTERSNLKLWRAGEVGAQTGDPAAAAVAVKPEPSGPAAAGEAETSGLKIVDVRIKKADLPPENQRAVYERMKAERAQQATKYRSEGEMRGQEIRANADRERAEILAKANRESLEIRGQADALAAATYAEAYSVDPEFYAFSRSLESYKNSFQDKSTIVLSTPDGMDYLTYFGKEKAD